VIGVKVWICRGEVYGKKDLAPKFSNPQKESSRPQRPAGRRGGFRSSRNTNNNR